MKPDLMFGGSNIFDTQQVYTESGLDVGAVGFVNGRSYVWCSHSGSETLTRGEPLAAAEPVVTAHNLDITTTGLNVGQTRIVDITAGVDAIAANAFAEGFLVVVDGAGEGCIYVIDRSLAFTATADGTVHLREGVTVASEADTQVSFIANKYVDPQRSKSTLRTPFVGVPNVTVPAGDTNTQYFWAQRNGYCPVFVEGTPALGDPVSVSSQLYGRLAAESDGSPVIGRMVSDAVDGEVQIVDLQNPMV